MSEVVAAAATAAAASDGDVILDPPLRARTLEILWHCNERNEEAELMGMQGNSLIEGITSIDCCHRNGRIVTTGGDKCIRMWQLKHHAIHAWLDNSSGEMTACARHVCTMRTAWMPVAARWSPHGEMIATAHCDGTLCLWWRDRNSGLYSGTADSHDSDSAFVRGSDGGGAVVCVGGPSTPGAPARAEEWKDYKHLSGHMSDVYDVAFSPDSRYLVSGAANGSVVIHDLGGSTMPVAQLMDQHTKFCRGVAWDPWGMHVHSFGGGPALQCYQVVPPRKAHGRLHLVNQRRCQGDFLGESCSLNFRRLSWSPDGLFLAAPYGKVPTRRGKASGSVATGRGQPSEGSIFDAIDAKRSPAAAVASSTSQHEQQRPPAKTARTERSGSGGDAITRSQEEVDTTNPADVAPATTERDSATTGVSTTVGSSAVQPQANDVDKYENENGDEHDVDEEEEETMSHCVNIYARDAVDKLASRLCVKGNNEIRGVQWAPCFLEPLPYIESASIVVSPQVSNATDAVAVESSAPRGSEKRSRSRSQTAPETPSRANKEVRPARTRLMTLSSATAAAISAGAWGPAEYRMALAVWTTDTVVVYTTDSPHRHSDFTDLHMRSISDVTWSADASLLFTASLDGYVSVISFRNALSPVSRLPTFCDRPVAKSLCALLERLAAAGKELEGDRSSSSGDAALKRQGASEAAVATAVEAEGSAAKPPATVAVVRKKKKPAQEDLQVSELTVMLEGAAPR